MEQKVVDHQMASAHLCRSGDPRSDETLLELSIAQEQELLSSCDPVDHLASAVVENPTVHRVRQNLHAKC